MVNNKALFYISNLQSIYVYSEADKNTRQMERIEKRKENPIYASQTLRIVSVNPTSLVSNS